MLFLSQKLSPTTKKRTKVMNKQFRFKQFDCIVSITHYLNNGAPAIRLVGDETEQNGHLDVFPGDAIATATVCLPEIKLAENETLIKDYSENEGILKVLVDNGIVKPTGIEIDTGFTKVHVVEVLVDRPKVEGF